MFLGVAELLVSPWGVLRLHQAIQHLYELAVTILLHFHTFKRVFWNIYIWVEDGPARASEWLLFLFFPLHCGWISEGILSFRLEFRVHALFDIHEVVVKEIGAAVDVVLLILILLLTLTSGLDDPTSIVSEWIWLSLLLTKHPKNLSKVRSNVTNRWKMVKIQKFIAILTA